MQTIEKRFPDGKRFSKKGEKNLSRKPVFQGTGNQRGDEPRNNHAQKKKEREEKKTER